MKKGTVIELKVNGEYYRLKGIEKGTHGVVVGDNQGNLTVMFFNERNVGDYAVCNVNVQDIEDTGCVLPDGFIAEINDKSDKLIKQEFIKASQFKEYDDVEVIVEKEKYTKHGVHKGMRGVIMEEYAIKNQWYVIFTDEKTGCDIADICIAEEDMIKL